jgi:hypothetical protein
VRRDLPNLLREFQARTVFLPCDRLGLMLEAASPAKRDRFTPLAMTSHKHPTFLPRCRRMQFGGRREIILGCPTRLSQVPLADLFQSGPPLLSKVDNLLEASSRRQGIRTLVDVAPEWWLL